MSSWLKNKGHLLIKITATTKLEVWLTWCWGSNNAKITWLFILISLHMLASFADMISFLDYKLPTAAPDFTSSGKGDPLFPGILNVVMDPQGHIPERWDVLVHGGQSWSWMWGQLHLDYVAWEGKLVILQRTCYVLLLENKKDAGQNTAILL